MGKHIPHNQLVIASLKSEVDKHVGVISPMAAYLFYKFVIQPMVHELLSPASFQYPLVSMLDKLGYQVVKDKFDAGFAETVSSVDVFPHELKLLVQCLHTACVASYDAPNRPPLLYLPLLSRVSRPGMFYYFPTSEDANFGLNCHGDNGVTSHFNSSFYKEHKLLGPVFRAMIDAHNKALAKGYVYTHLLSDVMNVAGAIVIIFYLHSMMKKMIIRYFHPTCNQSATLPVREKQIIYRYKKLLSRSVLVTSFNLFLYACFLLNSLRKFYHELEMGKDYSQETEFHLHLFLHGFLLLLCVYMLPFLGSVSQRWIASFSTQQDQYEKALQGIFSLLTRSTLQCAADYKGAGDDKLYYCYFSQAELTRQGVERGKVLKKLQGLFESHGFPKDNIAIHDDVFVLLMTDEAGRALTNAAADMGRDICAWLETFNRQSGGVYDGTAVSSHWWNIGPALLSRRPTERSGKKIEDKVTDPECQPVPEEPLCVEFGELDGARLFYDASNVGESTIVPVQGAKKGDNAYVFMPDNMKGDHQALGYYRQYILHNVEQKPYVMCAGLHGKCGLKRYGQVAELKAIGTKHSESRIFASRVIRHPSGAKLYVMNNFQRNGHRTSHQHPYEVVECDADHPEFTVINGPR